MHEPAETLDVKSFDESPAQRRGVWSVIREAVGGSERDFTEGPIGQAIFLVLLAVRVVLRA